MSQVNSEPGKSQAAGTKTVTAATAEVGVTDSKTKAAATAVPYTQWEPGKTYNPTRS